MSDLVFGAKQPYEAYYVEFDFVNDIADEDSISSATVVAKNGAIDVTATLTDVTKQLIDGIADVTWDAYTDAVKLAAKATVVSVWVMAGTTGVTYVITCQIVTVDGEKYEAEADLQVLEK